MTSRPTKIWKTTATSSVEEKGMITTRTERDLISELPDGILYVILQHMQLRDVARTSVLSHRWNYMCLSATILRFDWVQMFSKDANLEILKTSKNLCSEYEENFRAAINYFLKSYRGTHISSFRVSYCLSCHCTNDVNNWVRFALEKGVLDLSLDLYCSKFCSRNKNIDLFGRQEDDKYVLPCELFDGVKVNLKHLRLVSCILGPNLTYNFSSLEELFLHSMNLSLFNLQSLVSSLQNLRSLRFKRCCLPRKLDLGTLSLLQSFEASLVVGLQEIELSNLKLLTFQCICCKVVKCNFRGAPNLRSLGYLVSVTEYQHLFTYLPEQYPMLQHLRVCSFVDWAKLTLQCTTIFGHVTKLSLILWSRSKFSFLRIVSILGAFPKLRKFSLRTHCLEDVDQENLESVEYIPVHLMQVELDSFYSTPNQMEFAIYLLKSACVLKQLTIKASLIEERRMIYERLQKFAKDGVLVIE